jgi:hypothetical protein
MCGKTGQQTNDLKQAPALATRDRIIFMDLARRRASDSGSRAERRQCARRSRRGLITQRYEGRLCLSKLIADSERNTNDAD